MSSIVFMPHCGGGGDAELSTVLLTFTIVGVILIILGILINILHVKFSQGFGTSICWADIKPSIDNTFLGGFCANLGGIVVGAAALVGLGAGVYWFIITM
jgi:hypothetical protein